MSTVEIQVRMYIVSSSFPTERWNFQTRWSFHIFLTAQQSSSRSVTSLCGMTLLPIKSQPCQSSTLTSFSKIFHRNSASEFVMSWNTFFPFPKKIAKEWWLFPTTMTLFLSGRHKFFHFVLFPLCLCPLQTSCICQNTATSTTSRSRATVWNETFVLFFRIMCGQCSCHPALFSIWNTPRNDRAEWGGTRVGLGPLLKDGEEKEHAGWVRNLFSSSKFAPATNQKGQEMISYQSFHNRTSFVFYSCT